MQGPFVRDVAETHFGVAPGEYDHYNMKRMIGIAANIEGDDLGKAAELVRAAIKNVGAPPRGVTVNLRGQVPVMKSTFFSFQLGVCFAIVAIFLMLVAFFQAVRLSLIIISVVPTILAGALFALFLTHTTLNVQSFMGAIMAVGVGVANSILVVVFAEERRMTGISAKTAAITGAAATLAPGAHDQYRDDIGHGADGSRYERRRRQNSASGSSGDWRIDRFDLLRTSRFAFDLRHRATKV